MKNEIPKNKKIYLLNFSDMMLYKRFPLCLIKFEKKGLVNLNKLVLHLKKIRLKL